MFTFVTPEFVHTNQFFNSYRCHHDSVFKPEFQVTKGVTEISYIFLPSQKHVLMRVWTSLTRKNKLSFRAYCTRIKIDLNHFFYPIRTKKLKKRRQVNSRNFTIFCVQDET